MFVCMVGLPGSGKSTYAKKFAEKYDAVIVSTDAIRKELYGGEAVQGDGKEVFGIAYDRINRALQAGKWVVFDATSITAKSRRKVLSRISWYKGVKKVVFIATPLDVVFRQNAARDRQVPEEVIMRMVKSFNVPMEEEGWTSIECYTDKAFDVEAYFFVKVRPLAHENPHHKRDVYEHSLAMSEGYIRDYDWDKVLYYAIRYHDIGKPLTKFYGDDGVAHYYNHQNVGAYLILSSVGLELFKSWEYLELAWLVENHMVGFGKISEKFHKKWGPRLCERLEIIHKLDKEFA